MRQVGGFLLIFRFPPPIKLTTTIYITEILLKVALHTIKQTNTNESLKEEEKSFASIKKQKFKCQWTSQFLPWKVTLTKIKDITVLVRKVWRYQRGNHSKLDHIVCYQRGNHSKQDHIVCYQRGNHSKLDHIVCYQRGNHSKLNHIVCYQRGNHSKLDHIVCYQRGNHSKLDHIVCYRPSFYTVYLPNPIEPIKAKIVNQTIIPAIHLIIMIHISDIIIDMKIPLQIKK